MFCRNCGAQIDDKAVICIHCGASAGNQPMQAQPQFQQPVINVVNTNQNINAGYSYARKSKWTTFFLCLFLGYIGVHRFYIGKTGTGILYLFTGGLCGLGWVIDLLLILIGGLRDKAGQPLA